LLDFNFVPFCAHQSSNIYDLRCQKLAIFEQLFF